MTVGQMDALMQAHKRMHDRSGKKPMRQGTEDDMRRMTAEVSRRNRQAG